MDCKSPLTYYKHLKSKPIYLRMADWLFRLIESNMVQWRGQFQIFYFFFHFHIFTKLLPYGTNVVFYNWFFNWRFVLLSKYRNRSKIIWTSKDWTVPNNFGPNQKLIFTFALGFWAMSKTFWSRPKHFGPVKDSFRPI